MDRREPVEPRDSRTIEERLHPDGPPASHDPHRIERALHPDGPPAPRDPNWVESRLHPDGPPASHDPHRIERALHPDGPPAAHDPQRIADRLDGGQAPADRHEPPAAAHEPPAHEPPAPEPSASRNDAWGSDASSDQPDWTPSDPKYGRSPRDGFDPAFHHKALGDQFSPGVHDEHGSFSAKERAIADTVFEERGWRVDARKPDHTVRDQKNPECMTRKSPEHDGTVTEYKTLEPDDRSNPSGAVRRNIFTASKQVPPGGEVVIDGRNIGLTEADAQRGFLRAANQPHGKMVSTVHIIVADGRMLTFVKEA